MLAGCPPSQIEEYSCRAMNVPSLVMKEMNSLTHSCIHSLASLAILALSGSAPFIIRATGAKLRMLASEATSFLVFRGRSGCDRVGSRDAEDMTVRQSARCQQSKLQIWAGRSSSDSTVKMSKRAIGLYMGDGKGSTVDGIGQCTGGGAKGVQTQQAPLSVAPCPTRIKGKTFKTYRLQWVTTDLAP